MTTSAAPSHYCSPHAFHHHPYSGYRFDDNRLYTYHGSLEDSLDDEDQLPTIKEFGAIIADYLNNLSPKKRDKALVDHHRYSLIQQVLNDPRNTAISTAQFRFWVKKMFSLHPGTTDLVCHDNKPVAVKEDIYEILVKAHREAHHGGRDKTSALVRKRYSWIPKELVARFVRQCPFCVTRRTSGHSVTMFASRTSSPREVYARNSFGHESAAYTAPSIREDCEFSSSPGPPSAESGYESAPYYYSGLPSAASPLDRPYFNNCDPNTGSHYLYDQTNNPSNPNHNSNNHTHTHNNSSNNNNNPEFLGCPSTSSSSYQTPYESQLQQHTVQPAATMSPGYSIRSLLEQQPVHPLAQSITSHTPHSSMLLSHHNTYAVYPSSSYSQSQHCSDLPGIVSYGTEGDTQSITGRVDKGHFMQSPPATSVNTLDMLNYRQDQLSYITSQVQPADSFGHYQTMPMPNPSFGNEL